MKALQVAAGGTAGIKVEGVVKRYGQMQALGGIDLQVGPGEVLALLGPNGAGKSSLIRIIATAIIPDGGRVLLDGYDVVKDPFHARRKIGLVLADERSFFWRLSARRNMEFFASLHGMRRKHATPRIDAALDAVDLLDIADRRVDRFSSGMRNRLAIARALLGNPTCLLLDEPTRSLDPSSSLTIRRLVRKLADERQVAVLIATHDLHEAAAISSQVHILVAGSIATRLSGGENAADLEEALVAVTG
ncbi:MAG: ABC transporter ATP-binding protein [Acidimicrobiales bacterium]